MASDTWIRGGYRYSIAARGTAACAEAKALSRARPRLGGAAKFDESEHPRDSQGRFIRVGAHVRIYGGGGGTVVGVGKHGNIRVQLDGRNGSPGKTVERNRQYLTIDRNPDGSAPKPGAPAEDPGSAPTPRERPDGIGEGAGAGTTDTPDAADDGDDEADEGDEGDEGDVAALPGRPTERFTSRWAISDAMNDMVRDPEDTEPPAPHKHLNTWEKLIAQGEKDKVAFDAILDRVGADLGAPAPSFEEAKAMAAAGNVPNGLILKAPLKGLKRAQEKALGKYGGDWSRLTDVLRGTVVVRDLGDVPAAYDAIARHAEDAGWQVRKFENSYNEPGYGDKTWNVGANEAGYRDFKMTLVSPDGFLTELQMNTAAMFDAKEGDGHTWYEEMRPIIERVKAGGAPMTSEERALVKDRTERSRARYQGAYEASWPDEDEAAQESDEA